MQCLIVARLTENVISRASLIFFQLLKPSLSEVSTQNLGVYLTLKPRWIVDRYDLWSISTRAFARSLFLSLEQRGVYKTFKWPGSNRIEIVGSKFLLFSDFSLLPKNRIWCVEETNWEIKHLKWKQFFNTLSVDVGRARSFCKICLLQRVEKHSYTHRTAIKLTRKETPTQLLVADTKSAGSSGLDS